MANGNGNGKRNWAAEIALGLSVVAFSGMGLFLVQWGQAQERIEQLDRHGSTKQNQFERESRAQVEEMREQLNTIDRRSRRTEDLTESIAEKLGVYVPPRRNDE